MVWISVVLLGGGLAATFVPGLAAALAYGRDAVSDGELWRLVSGQLVATSPAAAVWQLGALALLAAWLELRSRVGLLVTLVLAAVAVALAAPRVAPGDALGPVGLDAGLFAFAGAWLSRNAASGLVRGAALLVLAATLGLLLWLARSGGDTPPGVVELPLAGGVAGLVAAALAPLWRRR